MNVEYPGNWEVQMLLNYNCRHPLYLILLDVAGNCDSGTSGKHELPAILLSLTGLNFNTL